MIQTILKKYPKTVSFIGNLRFPQLIYHAGLLLVGAGLALAYANQNWPISLFDLFKLLLTIAAVFCAWIASVVFNDLTDRRIDLISNSDRPLPSRKFSPAEYAEWGWIFFVASLFISALASSKVAALILLYQIIAFIYSARPLRLKRFAFISTFISALASLCVLFSGFILFSAKHNLDKFPSRIAFLLIIGYTLALPIKDFKDIDGDHADGVHTIPVFFGEAWGKVIVGSGLFFSFMLSVAVLESFPLFWWAFGCGLFSFALVWKMHPVKYASPSDLRSEFHWVNYRNIFWWMIGVIILYLAAVIYFVFI